MYLLSVAQLTEDGKEGPVPISSIAEKLEVKSVSVNQMMKKLADLGYVQYTPYKGVELLPAGQKAANKVIRNRRIWEVFLVDNLKIPFTEAEALSCDFEHVTTVDVISRLEEYLGNPRFSPKGKPIPVKGEPVSSGRSFFLSDLPVDHTAIIKQVELTGSRLEFLEQQGLRPGTEVTVTARGKEKETLVEHSEGSLILNKTIAEKINVEEHND